MNDIPKNSGYRQKNAQGIPIIQPFSSWSIPWKAGTLVTLIQQTVVHAPSKFPYHQDVGLPRHQNPVNCFVLS